MDLSTQQLADRLHVTPRMINIYRAEAEARLGRKLGSKRGRTTYFNPEEQVAIVKVQAEGVTAAEASERHQAQAAPNFQAVNNQAEDGILGGMSAIVQVGDQKAIATGQALGDRWTALMFGAALQQMQNGVLTMQNHLDELHTSVSLTLEQVDPKLLSGSIKPEYLLEYSDEASA
jgi:hypothetical protein